MTSAASAASSGVATSASPGTGTPCRASSALDSASDRVGTPHDTNGPPPLRESAEHHPTGDLVRLHAAGGALQLGAGRFPAPADAHMVALELAVLHHPVSSGAIGEVDELHLDGADPASAPVDPQSGGTR